MNPQTYLREKFDILIESFPGIKIKYEIKKRDYDNHIIEILPIEMYENKKYMEIESDISFEFEQLFQEDEIMFVSEKSLTRVKNPVLTLGFPDYSFVIKQEKGFLTNVLSILGINTNIYVFDADESALETKNKDDNRYHAKAGKNINYALAA